MRLTRRPDSGLSLVEILLAMAVFLIGILAVLQIFPRGLSTLTRVSDEQEAIRLAEAQMNRLTGVQDRLPDYILPAGEVTDTNPGPVATPNPGFGFLRTMAGTEAYRPYDYDLPFVDTKDAGLLHRLLAGDRLVVGERVTVGRRQVAGSGGAGSSALQTVPRPYNTLFGPLQTVTDSGGQTVADVAVFRDFDRVSALELRQTQVTSGGSPAWQDRPVFAVVPGGTDPYTGAPLPDKLLFELDSTARLVSIRCGYHDSYGNARWAQLQPVTIPAAAMPADNPYTAVDLLDPQAPHAALTQVIPESVQVRQVMTRDTGSGTLPRFSFRDALLAPEPAPSDATKRPTLDPGVLYFSPSQTGEHLSLEYVVSDWRILNEQVSLTVDSAGAIQGLDANGNLQIAGRNLDENFAPFVVVPATGQVISVSYNAWQVDPSLPRNGLIPIPAGTVVNSASGSQDVLVYYRRDGNWLVAPSLAPTAYQLTNDAVAMTSTGNASDYPVQSLLVEPHQVPSATTYTELWFCPSEAGRAVTVTYEVDGANGRELVTGEMHVVPTQANRTSGGANSVSRHAIVLNRPRVSVDSNAATPRPMIHAVEGRSLQLRVTYDEDIAGRPASPVKSTPDPAVSYNTAEKLVEMATYVRRTR